MKTTYGTCARKKRFASRAAAETVAERADVPLRAYKCELCHQFHLTGRTKGMRLPAFEVDRRRALKARKRSRTAP